MADAAQDQCRLDRLDFAISRVALAKEDGHRHSLDDRVEALRALTRGRPWVGVVVTDQQLVTDMAEGYDVVVMGADKWAQLHDPAFYGSEVARDEALARLPVVAVAPRPPTPIQTEGTVILSLPHDVAPVSSTAVHEGRHDWDGRRRD